MAIRKLGISTFQNQVAGIIPDGNDGNIVCADGQRWAAGPGVKFLGKMATSVIG